MPILNTVKYDVHVHFKNGYIKDVKSLAWCEIVHGVYSPPNTRYTPECPITLTHPDFTRWLTADMHYHIGKLCPTQPKKKIAKLVKDSKWSELVHDVGGVNPVQLARFVSPGDTIVMEAVLHQRFTECMKQCGKVWMSQDDLAPVLREDPTWRKKIEHMVSKKFLVPRMINGVHCMALGWAATQYDSFTVLPVVRFKNGVRPVEVLSSVDLEVDTRYPVDRWINAQKLASSMLPVLGVPNFDPVHYHTKKDLPLAKEYMANQVDVKNPVLCISDRGQVGLDTGGWYCAQVVKPVLDFPKGAIVGYKNTQHNSLIVKGKGKEPIPITFDQFDCSLVRLDTMRFTHLSKLNPDLNYGTIVAFMTLITPPRWIYELSRFETNSKVEYVLIKV